MDHVHEHHGCAAEANGDNQRVGRDLLSDSQQNGGSDTLLQKWDKLHWKRALHFIVIMFLIVIPVSAFLFWPHANEYLENHDNIRKIGAFLFSLGLFGGLLGFWKIYNGREKIKIYFDKYDDKEAHVKEDDKKTGGIVIMLSWIIICIGIIMFLLVSGVALVVSEMGPKLFSKLLVCSFAIPLVEGLLVIVFLSGFVWAISLYWRNREDINLKEQDGNQKDGKQGGDGQKDNNKQYHLFYDLASKHNKLSQLWFTIAFTIFIGGLIYAIFHVGSHICEWIDHENGVGPWDVIYTSLPNLFIYSLFFVVWAWSIKHHRAHWHEFVINQYKYTALMSLKDLANQSSIPQAKDKVILVSAAALMLPPESPYVEKETSVTGTERLVRLEEWIRELLVQKEK